MLSMPTLETERLLIRPFVVDDLEAIHQLLDLELREADFGSEGPQTFGARRQWLHWTILSYEELAKLYQPPYSDRAIILKQDNRLIGTCGFVPCLAPFGQLRVFPSTSESVATHSYSTEFGLFYAIAPASQRQGYATEASKALIAYAFDELQLQRVVATTTQANIASINVMQKVGMQITKNPYPDPPWLQVVGILENNSGR
ncbi:MAG: GNAT family N-acetyltransferase [Deltaproteobacteria bacterium]|nr:GNAT family N-acetyltransferase [Deltaproteobacteria bacterium]